MQRARVSNAIVEGLAKTLQPLGREQASKNDRAINGQILLLLLGNLHAFLLANWVT